LLDKLNSYGIRGESNLYFKSHFSNWFQFVEIKDNDCSNSFTVILCHAWKWCMVCHKDQFWAAFIFVI
jgi:hypothetical protein